MKSQVLERKKGSDKKKKCCADGGQREYRCSALVDTKAKCLLPAFKGAIAIQLIGRYPLKKEKTSTNCVSSQCKE